MIDIVSSLNKEFENRYDFLKFLDIVYETDISLCTLTFLYPYDEEEFSLKDQKEIQKYIQKLFSLNGSVKVKFKKSYLDEKLVKNEIIEYFKLNKKALMPYISEENISSFNEGRELNITIKLNRDILKLVNVFELKNNIKDYVEKMFIANANITIKENDEGLPEEIECDDILPVATKARRYKVKITKKIFGKEIVPMPEYISDMKKQKTSVILSGTVLNKNKKTFTIKKGKKQGEEKSLYSFVLKDCEGEIECVYFCPKSHEKDMEKFGDGSMLLCVGDVRPGLSGKLTYYVRSMSLCTDKIEEEVSIYKSHKTKKVVNVDILPRSNQENIFDKKPNYNQFIKENNIVVFDLETTGLDSENCEITEIGAVKIEHGEVTERFASFARTKEPIPLEVQKLTHITDEMLIGAPNIEDIIQEFFEWCDGCIISGYNVINFDMKFVNKVASKIGIEFKNQVVDTINVVRKSGLRLTNYKLGTVVKALGLVLNDAHRAFNDAYATAQVLLELNKEKN